MTMMNVPSLSTVQPPLVFKVKVIFPCWCLVTATQLEITLEITRVQFARDAYLIIRCVM